VEIEIQLRQAKNKTAVILATIPGCGAYSSLALACRIDPIERDRKGDITDIEWRHSDSMKERSSWYYSRCGS
jgi:hypothetical protein